MKELPLIKGFKVCTDESKAEKAIDSELIIKASIKEMVRLLGSVHKVYNHSDIKYKWIFENNSGNGIVTIYDWKDNCSYDQDRIIDWHLGRCQDKYFYENEKLVDSIAHTFKKVCEDMLISIRNEKQEIKAAKKVEDNSIKLSHKIEVSSVPKYTNIKCITSWVEGAIKKEVESITKVYVNKDCNDPNKYYIIIDKFTFVVKNKEEYNKIKDMFMYMSCATGIINEKYIFDKLGIKDDFLGANIQIIDDGSVGIYMETGVIRSDILLNKMIIPYIYTHLENNNPYNENGEDMWEMIDCEQVGDKFSINFTNGKWYRR